MKNTAVLLFTLLISIRNLFPQDKYLLVVDVQSTYFEGTTYEKQAAEMIGTLNRIIEKTEPSRVIYIKGTGKTLSLSSKGIKVLPVMPAPELDRRLMLVNDNVFIKSEGDAFTSEDLNLYLSEHNVKDIMVTGLLAEECIYRTAVGGKEKGYNIYVIPEGITGETDEKKEKVMGKLVKRGIRILPVDEVISEQ